MSSGDQVAAENYLQHAEHYNRIILAAQLQNPGMPGIEGQNGMNGGGRFNQHEQFRRDYDGDGEAEEGDGEDYVPQQRPFHERPEQRNFNARPEQRSFNERPERGFNERPAYNQHQQPQPYIPQNAFPHAQPQPAVPVPNGGTPHAGENFGNAPEGDRMPRRRRRRPIGDTQAGGYNGRNGGHETPAVNGTAPGANSTPDDVGS